jgi:hypothetical protein
MKRQWLFLGGLAAMAVIPAFVWGTGTGTGTTEAGTGALVCTMGQDPDLGDGQAGAEPLHSAGIARS